MDFIDSRGITGACRSKWIFLMLDRLSVNGLLKSVIAVMAAAVVTVLSLSAWESWTRLKTADQIAAIVDASGHIFTALHNLRVDRSATVRELALERQHAELPKQLRDVRAVDM